MSSKLLSKESPNLTRYSLLAFLTITDESLSPALIPINLYSNIISLLLVATIFSLG